MTLIPYTYAYPSFSCQSRKIPQKHTTSEYLRTQVPPYLFAWRKQWGICLFFRLFRHSFMFPFLFPPCNRIMPSNSAPFQTPFQPNQTPPRLARRYTGHGPAQALSDTSTPKHRRLGTNIASKGTPQPHIFAAAAKHILFDFLLQVAPLAPHSSLWNPVEGRGCGVVVVLVRWKIGGGRGGDGEDGVSPHIMMGKGEMG